MKNYIPTVHISEEWPPLLKRLGLEYVVEDKVSYFQTIGDGTGSPYPSTIEEAAYLLAGVRSFYIPNRHDSKGALNDDSRNRLRLFINSGGYVIYALLNEALDSGELESLDFNHLVEWSKKIEPFLTKVPEVIRNLLLKAAEARRLQGRVPLVLPAFEYAYANAQLRIDRRAGSAQDRDLFRAFVVDFKGKNPNCRFADIKAQPFAKELLCRVGEDGKRVYDEETVKEWCKDFALNTAPGRPRKVKPGQVGNGG
jgi:hypothetical protein